MTSTPPQELLVQSLGRIHTALRRSLETIIRVSKDPVPEGDRGDFADFCERFTRFLHTHHDGEEEIVFPKLTEVAGRGSLPESASEVTKWRADHQSLLVHLKAFDAACAQFRTGGPLEPLHRTANEVRGVLFPHLDAEEKVLDGSPLAKLLRDDEVFALESAASKHGQRTGGPKVLMLLVHQLTDDEQIAQFSQMPWIVRKVLMKWIWAGGFRGCLKYAHNPSIAL